MDAMGGGERLRTGIRRLPVRSAPLNNSRTLQREGTMRCIDSGREKGRGVRRRRPPIGPAVAAPSTSVVRRTDTFEMRDIGASE